MSAYETVTVGRAKRSTAGNRMRELLEKAHQEDEDDIFAEVENDEEFEAPQDIRDVFLDEFADTDEEIEEDEEATERALEKEERRKAKGKSKAIYNPLASQPKPKKPTEVTSTALLDDPTLALLDPSLDPSAMAPSTLMMALRKHRREAKRLNRSEARRSNLRASTLKTEEEIKAREEAERRNRGNKGRRPQHETGEVRGLRPMTQDELIAAALEEEERNKEALRDWLKKEDEKRELRRVGRKRVKGPRWTWVSRTVGKLVEVVGETEGREGEGEEKEGEKVEGPSKDAARGEPVEENLEGVQTEPTKPIESNDQTEELTPAAAREVTETGQVLPAGTIQSGQPKTSESTVDLLTQPDDKPSNQTQPAEIAPPMVTEGEPIRQPTLQPVPAAQPSDELSAQPMTDKTPHTSSEVGAQSDTHETTQLTESRVTQPSNATLEQPNPTIATQIPNEIPVQSNTQPSTHLETAPSSAIAGPSTTPIQPPASTAAAPPTEQLAVKALNTTQPPTDEPSKYTRNYLILSQVPGGLPAELKLVLGDHVEWDEVTYIPARNRPIVRRQPMCSLTGLPARYRHPATGIPYANVEGYKTIEALLANRYVYDEGGWWLGGEEDVCAEGMEEVEGWWEAVNGGWLGGKEVVVEPEAEAEVEPEVDQAIVLDEPLEPAQEARPAIGKGKRKRTEDSATPAPKKGKGTKGKVAAAVDEGAEEVVDSVTAPVPRKGKSKSRKR